MPNEIRYVHSFQYKQYHSLTLEATVMAEDSIEAAPAVVEALQQVYGESVLKMFERYKANWQNADLQAYLNAVIPTEVMLAVRSNPILMDSLLLATAARLERQKEEAQK